MTRSNSESRRRSVLMSHAPKKAHGRIGWHAVRATGPKHERWSLVPAQQPGGEEGIQARLPFLPLQRQFATRNNASTTRTCRATAARPSSGPPTISAGVGSEQIIGDCAAPRSWESIILGIVIHGVARRMGDPAGALSATLSVGLPRWW